MNPPCKCHGEPLVRTGGQRGGGWECRAKARERARRWYDANRERKKNSSRERYDNDPIYRIQKRERHSARMRAESLKRRKELHRGEVSLEGRS